MKKIITPDLNNIHPDFYSLLENAKVYDSSSSEEARVIFIDKDNGYFLKYSSKGALENEAKLAQFFNKNHLTSQVLTYISEEKDWLLTERVPGEDCTLQKYLDNPQKLCDATAEMLRGLHELDIKKECPCQNRTEAYFATAENNYRKGIYDRTFFPEDFGYSSPHELWDYINKNRHLLKSNVLIHGDYCLPNIILNNWNFSGFIDLGAAGIADRHIDVFWGIWSLYFNLKTNKYQNRFIDAYGRQDIEPELLKLVAATESFG